jgi:hypothetical protein
MRDTHPAVDDLVLAIRRRTDSSSSFRAALDLSETMRRAALAQLRSSHPELPERQLVALLVARRYGITVPQMGR